MKKVYTLLLMLAPFFSIAQSKVAVDSTKKDSTKEVKKSEFTASINHQTKLHYFGRTDSLQSGGTFSLITYTFKSGWYVQATSVFVNNQAMPFTYAGTAAEVGYNFPEKKHFEGNLYLSKFIYQDKSLLVQSALEAQSGVNLTYKNKIINMNGGLDLKLSNTVDIGVKAGVDHLFIKKIKGWKKAAFAFMPAVTVNAGTQKFTNTYLDKENMLGVPVTRQRTETVERFNILSYDLSLQLVLVKGKFFGYAAPSYVIPQNLVVGEQGKNLFYASFGVGVKL